MLKREQGLSPSPPTSHATKEDLTVESPVKIPAFIAVLDYFYFELHIKMRLRPHNIVSKDSLLLS